MERLKQGADKILNATLRSLDEYIDSAIKKADDDKSDILSYYLFTQKLIAVTQRLDSLISDISSSVITADAADDHALSKQLSGLLELCIYARRIIEEFLNECEKTVRSKCKMPAEKFKSLAELAARRILLLRQGL